MSGLVPFYEEEEKEEYQQLNDYFQDLFEEKSKKSYFYLQIISTVSFVVGLILWTKITDKRKRRYLVDGIIIGLLAKIIIVVLIINYFQQWF